MNTTEAVLKIRPEKHSVNSPVFPVSYSSLHEFIMNDHNDELPVGFLAQLVEQCTDTAEVMGSKSLNFLEALFALLLNMAFIFITVFLHL